MLRFQELEPAKPWRHLLDATHEGPICYQEDVIYERIMQPRGFSEECIHANIYVPLEGYSSRRRRLAPPFTTAYAEAQLPLAKHLPVLVFVHGGGFQSGSGDPDLHGPEYLVTKNVIVITFNYRYEYSLSFSSTREFTRIMTSSILAFATGQKLTVVESFRSKSNTIVSDV